jgi:hypothetical protein
VAWFTSCALSGKPGLFGTGCSEATVAVAVSVGAGLKSGFAVDAKRGCQWWNPGPQHLSSPLLKRGCDSLVALQL